MTCSSPKYWGNYKAWDYNFDTKTFGFIWKYVRTLNNKTPQNENQIKLDRRDINEDEPMLDKRGRDYSEK